MASSMTTLASLSSTTRGTFSFLLQKGHSQLNTSKRASNRRHQDAIEPLAIASHPPPDGLTRAHQTCVGLRYSLLVHPQLSRRFSTTRAARHIPHRAAITLSEVLAGRLRSVRVGINAGPYFLKVARLWPRPLAPITEPIACPGPWPHTHC
jgi:hypothetical protein